MLKRLQAEDERKTRLLVAEMQAAKEAERRANRVGVDAQPWRWSGPSAVPRPSRLTQSVAQYRTGFTKARLRRSHAPPFDRLSSCCHSGSSIPGV